MERQVFPDARRHSFLPSTVNLEPAFEAIDLSMVKSEQSLPTILVSKTVTELSQEDSKDIIPCTKMAESISNSDPLDVPSNSKLSTSIETVDTEHPLTRACKSPTKTESDVEISSDSESDKPSVAAESLTKKSLPSQVNVNAHQSLPIFESVYIKEEPSSPWRRSPKDALPEDVGDYSEEESDDSEILEPKIEIRSRTPSPTSHISSGPISVHLINSPEKCTSLLPNDDVEAVNVKPVFKITAQEYPINLTGEKPYICGVCGKTFVTNQNLQCHFRTHTGERPFKCDTCGKTFLENRHYKLHLNTHTGVRPFKCETCGKSFIYNSNLQCHLKLHTGVKPFKCSACGNAYITNQNLQRHLKSHSGVRPFECSTCGKTFTEDRHLQRHLKSHTGIRPFKCQTCGKSFIENHDLQRHIRIHTEGRQSKAKS